MKIIALLIMILLLIGCKSKKVLKSTISETEITQIKSEKKEQNIIEKDIHRQETKKTQVSNQKKETATDIEVKGKAEADKPLEIFNIENGDTLQTFKVTGSANVIFRSKASKSNEVKTEKKSESLVEKFKQFSENIVEENNVKERFKEVKNKTKDVKVKGFQAGLWIAITIVIFFLIFIFFTYKYLRNENINRTRLY